MPRTSRASGVEHIAAVAVRRVRALNAPEAAPGNQNEALAGLWHTIVGAVQVPVFVTKAGVSQRHADAVEALKTAIAPHILQREGYALVRADGAAARVGNRQIASGFARQGSPLSSLPFWFAWLAFLQLGLMCR